MTYSRNSQKCYEDLTQEGLVKHYPDWEDKTTGAMTGVTLFGRTKGGESKKVFVKSYRDDGVRGDMHELYDYVAFNILKKCGIHAPKVKLKGLLKDHLNDDHNRVYIFSSDIARRQNKHLQRKYYYSDLNKSPVVIDFSNGTLRSSRNLFAQDSSSSATHYIYPIDKASIPRLLLLTNILNMSDLHGGNIGFVISEDNNQVKAKLTIVDFTIFIHPIHITDYDSLLNYVTQNNFYLQSNLMGMFDEQDCIKAFRKIEKNFLGACDEMVDKIKAMPFETERRKLGTLQVIEQWKVNFLTLQNFVHGLEALRATKETVSIRGLTI